MPVQSSVRKEGCGWLVFPCENRGADAGRTGGCRSLAVLLTGFMGSWERGFPGAMGPALPLVPESLGMWPPRPALSFLHLLPSPPKTRKERRAGTRAPSRAGRQQRGRCCTPPDWVSSFHLCFYQAWPRAPLALGPWPPSPGPRLSELIIQLAD